MFLVQLFIFMLILSLFLDKFKLGQILNFLMIFLIIIIILGFVDYTPDKKFYEYWIYNIPDHLEPFFKLSATYLVKHQYGYKELHLFFISTYTFILLFLISRFSNKLFLISLLHISTILIFYVTQLRYFMGFYAVCLGIYYFYVSRNLLLAIFFLVFGMSNHYGLISFVAIIPFFHIKTDKILSKLVIVTIIILLVTLFIVGVGAAAFSQVRFIGYFVSELQSSFLGGLLTFLPYIIIVYFIQQLHKKNISKNSNITDDKKYHFLYIMSITNICLLGVALITQVVGHRMIMPATLFQILFVFYSMKYYDGDEKAILVIKFISIVVIFLFYMYVFTELIAGGGSSEDIIKIFTSNKLLNLFLF
ncbi:MULTISPECIES: EpsG family protein [unclassified Chryseobacterium]|uniref:EpsG family protein n=1 Tax=unclassified Chryseobacterium TaxID=2593645 RepID=UPI00226AAC73|nr:MULTISPECIES: EpsG family protein [unclassified Chryseobacterium]